MERNESFPIQDLQMLSVRLAWAQLEIYTDDIDQLQVIASGDAHTVGDLKIEIVDGELVIEQPQYGLSLDITRGHWMQVCIRMPKTWDREIKANTISGLIVARGLGGDTVAMDTVAGDIRANRITAGKISLKTTAGKIHGEELMSDWLTSRSVSGNITLTDISAQSYRLKSVSGDIRLKMKAGFEQMELRTISGDTTILTEAEAISLSMRSVSGRKTVDGVKITESEEAPTVHAVGVSGNLSIIGIRK